VRGRGILGGVFERFTDRARRVLVLAQEEARLLRHPFIGTEHLLLGLLHEGDGVAAKVLEDLAISLETVRQKVEETVGISGSTPMGSPPFTPRAKKVLELSLREALHFGHNYIGTEHILLGVVREGEGVAAQVLRSLGADATAVRSLVVQKLSGYGAGPPWALRPESGTAVSQRSALVRCSFCGRTPPVAGRLVAGRNAFICEGCVAAWAAALGEESGAEPVTSELYQPDTGPDREEDR